MKVLFEQLEILNETKEAIKAINLEYLTPIQELAIPLMLNKKDFIAQAQTGTGKTFAFAIPIIEMINVKQRGTQALVLCPTRELAMQVYNEFIKLVKFNRDITVTPIVGGESYDKQFKSLKRKPHIIVGTPGRIIDHMDRQTIDLNDLEMLTFDEADEMLKMGFEEDIERILRDTKEENRQTVLFSATIPNEIKKIAKKYQKDAEIIKVEASQLTVSSITQNYFVVQKRDKLNLVKRILDSEQTTSAIIFANTKKEVDEITEELRNDGIYADALHGDLKQSQRTHVTNSFRKKDLTILVATDVAARGLDISGVELVLNYELPHENEIYVHRIGRTGRAGLSGKAYSILTPRTEGKIYDLERFTNSKIGKIEVPSTKKINQKRIGKYIDDLSTEAFSNTNEYNEIINRFQERGIGSDQLLNALLAKTMPSDKDYPDIEFVKPKERRENNNKKGNNDRRERNERSTNGGYSLYKINVGRKDKVTPIYILEMLSSTFNLRNRNIGDIKHHDKHTVVEISPKASSIIGDKKHFKYKGKTINIETI